MTDLTTTHQELVSRGQSAPLDPAIAAWLDAKANKSGSKHTAKIYTTELASFRSVLQNAGLDLDADPRAVALAAQGWAGQGAPAPATFNRRIAVLSSFYTFAKKRGFLSIENPIGLVERRTVHQYENVNALTPAEVKPKLAGIGRATEGRGRDAADAAHHTDLHQRRADGREPHA